MDNSIEQAGLERLSPRFTVREAVPEDCDAVCQLFERVFGEVMTTEHWQWKYDRPNSRAIVVFEKDILVAHYGGVGSNICIEGKPGTAIQISDLMVDKKVRHAIRSSSPFYLSAKLFLESYVGFDRPFLLAYGFPSKRAMTLSERLGLYAPVGSMWEVKWDSLNASSRLPGKITRLDQNNFPRFETKIERLWEQFREQFGNYIICEKNSPFFRWRYIDHPSANYSIYIVETGFIRRPIGLFVLRHDQGKNMLMDVLSGPEQLGNIISAAQQVTASQGLDSMTAWISDPFLSAFENGATEVNPLPIVIPANTCSSGPSPNLQKNKWWLMPGDTDYQ